MDYNPFKFSERESKKYILMVMWAIEIDRANKPYQITFLY